MAFSIILLIITPYLKQIKDYHIMIIFLKIFFVYWIIALAKAIISFYL